MDLDQRDVLRAEGARNLLEDCAGLASGASVLIVCEAGEDPFFDPEVGKIVATKARSLGMRPELRLADPSAPEIPKEIVVRMHDVDATLFFSRLGGRARFSAPKAPGPVVNCYATTPDHLGDPFCTLNYATQRAIHDALVHRISRASGYRIVAPCGTDLSGRVSRRHEAALTDFALELFPLMIFPPVMCDELTGRLVIDHFVTSSATRAYDDSVLMLNNPLTASVEDSRIVALNGPADLVTRLKDQMHRATALTGGDPMQINSWHTGINPNTFTETRAMEDPDRWGAMAFGSPRYTHFHASGHDPGDIAFSLFDASISFDGVPFWTDGRFAFLELPEIAALVPPEDLAALSPAAPRDIGF